MDYSRLQAQRAVLSGAVAGVAGDHVPDEIRFAAADAALEVIVRWQRYESPRPLVERLLASFTDDELAEEMLRRKR